MNDLGGYPLSEEEKREVLKTCTVLNKAIEHAAVDTAVKQANAIRLYGLKDLSNSAFIVIADSAGNIYDQELFADKLDEMLNPSASIVYDKVLSDAIQSDNSDMVIRMVDKLEMLPDARGSWLKGMRYLMKAAQEKNDMDQLIRLSSKLFYNADFDGARGGFENCMACEEDPKKRIDIALEYESFGFNLFTRKEISELLQNALQARNDNATVRFLDVAYDITPANAIGANFSYLNTLINENKPLKTIIDASVRLAHSDDKAVKERFLNLWRARAAQAQKDKNPHDIELIADYCALNNDKNTRLFALDLYEDLLLRDTIGVEKKMMLLQKVTELGTDAHPVLEKEAPKIIAEAEQKEVPTMVQYVSWMFLGSESPLLKTVGLKGYTNSGKKLIAEGNFIDAMQVGKNLLRIEGNKNAQVNGKKIWCQAYGELVNKKEYGQQAINDGLDMLSASNDTELQESAQMGILTCLDAIKDDDSLMRLDIVSRLIAVNDPVLKKSADEIISDVYEEAISLQEPEVTLVVAERFIASGEEDLRAKAVTLLEKLWDAYKNGAEYSPEFVEHMINLMSVSGDATLVGIADKSIGNVPEE